MTDFWRHPVVPRLKAFLEQAVLLTADLARYVERSLVAAQASLQAGAFSRALELLSAAEAGGSGALDELASARVDLLRGHIAFASSPDSDTPVLLLNAARRLEPFDVEVARETYLMAFGAVSVAGTAAGGDVLMEICHAAQALPAAQGDRRPLGLLLHGLALLTTEGHAAATPTLQRAAQALADIAVDDVLRWGWVATAASTAVWDDEAFYVISTRQVQLVEQAAAGAEGSCARPTTCSPRSAWRRSPSAPAAS